MYKFLVLSILFLFSWSKRIFLMDIEGLSSNSCNFPSSKLSQPWRTDQQEDPRTGFYIGKNQIMTNAHVVANGKYITVQKDGIKPVIARVKFIAHDSDLVLEVKMSLT